MKGGRGKSIPDEDRVMRHVPWARLRKDEDGNVLGILPQALQLRPQEEYLSVNWVEFYDGDEQTRIQNSVWAIRDSFEKPLGPKSGFAIANVGTIKEVSVASGSRVRVTHEPKDDVNPAHAGIRQMPRDDLALLEAMATDAFTELISNQTVPNKP